MPPRVVTCSKCGHECVLRSWVKISKDLYKVVWRCTECSRTYVSTSKEEPYDHE